MAKNSSLLICSLCLEISHFLWAFKELCSFSRLEASVFPGLLFLYYTYLWEKLNSKT